MQKQKVILILSGEGDNDAINAVCHQFELLFQQAGKNTYFIDVSTADFTQKLVDAITNVEIEFAFSYLGIGADLAWKSDASDDLVNLWEYHNIPFLKLQGDLPAYFIERHGPTPATSINLYSSPEFAQVQNWYYATQKTPHIIHPPVIFDQQAVEKIDFKKRQDGSLVFMKNGNDPKQLINLWNSNLSPAMAQDLCDIAEALLPPVLNCEPINIFEYIVHFVTAKMGDALACREIVRLYAAQLDDFFRRVKATMLATSLKKFPVKIIGKNWEHVNDSKSVATFSNDLNFSQHSKQIFANELGLIDMTPNVDLNVHDRFCRAAGNYAFILTNQSTWMQENIPEFNDYTYTFDSEQFENKVAFLLANKELVVEQGRLLGEYAQERIKSTAFVNPLIEAAEKMKFIQQAEKPAMQDYYLW
jgi:hypothetical protein